MPCFEGEGDERFALMNMVDELLFSIWTNRFLSAQCTEPQKDMNTHLVPA